MVNEKNYLEFLDIPDGSGGTERWHAKDAEAQEFIASVPSTYATKNELADGTLYPVDMATVTPTTTFVRNSILAINGMHYKAVRDTLSLPVTLVVEDNAFVTHEIDFNGQTCWAYVVSDDTIHSDWILWSDGSIGFNLGYLEQSFEASMAAHQDSVQTILDTMDSELDALENTVNGKATISDVLALTLTASSGTQYTVGQLLAAVANMMNQTVVVNE